MEDVTCSCGTGSVPCEEDGRGDNCPPRDPDHMHMCEVCNGTTVIGGTLVVPL